MSSRIGRRIVDLCLAFMVGYLVANFADIVQDRDEFYNCQLARQESDRYTTSRYQLAAKSSMIIMQRDGRTFMFRREDVVACEGIK